MLHRMSGDAASSPERPASTLTPKRLPGRSTSELERAVAAWLHELDRALRLSGPRRERIRGELTAHFEDLLASLEGMPPDYAAMVVAQACGDPAAAASRFERNAAGRDATRALSTSVAAFLLLAGVWMSSLFFFPRSPWPNDQPPPSVARWLTPGYVAWWLGLALVAVSAFMVRRRVARDRAVALWPMRLVATGAAAMLMFHVVFGAAFAFARDRDVSASTHGSTVWAMTGIRALVALVAVYLLTRAVSAVKAR